VLWLRSASGNAFLLSTGLDVGQEYAGNARLGADALATDLWTGAVVEHPSIRDIDGNERLAADRITVGIDRWALAHGRLHLTAVAVDGWRAHVVVSDDGTVDLLDLVGLPADFLREPLPAAVDIDALVLSDGTLDLEVAGNIVRIEGVNLTAEVHGADRIDVTGLRVDGRLITPVQGALLATGALGWDGDALSLDGLAVDVGASHAGIDGTLSQVWDGGDAAVTVSLAPLALTTVPEAGWNGAFAGTAHVTGPWRALAVNAALDGSGGTRGNLAFDGMLELAPGLVQWNGTASADGVHVEDVIPGLDAPIVVGGSSTIDGSGVSVPGGLVAAGQLTGGPQSALGLTFDDVAADWSLRDGIITVTDGVLHGPLGESGFAGTVDVATQGVELDVTSELDVAALVGLGGPELLRGTGALAGHVGGTVRGGVVLDGSGDAQLSRLTFGDGVAVGAVTARWTAAIRGTDVAVDARATATGVTAFGATVDDVKLSGIEAAFHPVRGLKATARADVGPIALGELLRGDGATARVGYRADLHGNAVANADIALGRLVSPYVTADGGAATAAVDGQELAFTAGFDRDGIRLGEGSGALDLGSRAIRLDEFTAYPAPGQRWTAEPTAFVLGDGGVTGLDLALASDRGQVRIAGDLALDGAVRADLAVRGLDPRAVAELFPARLPAGMPALHGSIDFDGTLGGTAHALAVDGTVHAREVGADGVLTGLTADGSVHAEGHAVTVDLALGAGDELATVRGAIPAFLDVDRLGPDPDGAVGLDVRVPRGRVDRVFAAFELGFLPQPAVDWTTWLGPEGEASVHVTGPLRSPVLVADVSGAVPVGGWRRPGVAEVHVERHGADVTVAGAVREGDTERVKLDATAKTDVDALLGWLLGVGDRPPDVRTVGLYVHDVGGTALLHDLPVQSLIRVFSPYPLDASGNLTGKVDFGGQGTAIAATAALVVVDGRIGTVNLDSVQAAVVPAGDGYTVNAVVAFPPQPDPDRRGMTTEAGLHVDGDVPVSVDLGRWPGDWAHAPMELHVGGAGIPIGVVSALIPDIEDPDGVVAVTGVVRGTPWDPQPDLHVAIDDGALTAHDLGIRAEHLALSADVGGDGASFVATGTTSAEKQQLRGFPGGRSGFEAQGAVPIDGWHLGELGGTVALDELLVASRHDQLVRVSTLADPGPLTLEGAWPHLGVRGHLRVDQCDVHVTEPLLINLGLIDGPPHALDPRIAVVRPGVDTIPGAPPKDPFWAPFTADLTIDVGSNAEGSLEFPYLQSFGGIGAVASTIDMQGRLAGSVHAVLADGRPILDGTLDVLSGQARVLDSRFVVEQGTVTFLDEDFLNPTADVHASMVVPGARIDLGIQGTPSDADVVFSSPDLPARDQVLFAVITGENPLDADAGSSGLLLAGAAARLATRSLVSGVNLGAFQLKDGMMMLSSRVGNATTLTLMQAVGFSSGDSHAVELAYAYSPQITVTGSWGNYSKSLRVDWRKRW
jgi:hypothetical protein